MRARGRGLQALRGLFKGQEDNVLSFLLEVAGQDRRREQKQTVVKYENPWVFSVPKPGAKFWRRVGCFPALSAQFTFLLSLQNRRPLQLLPPVSAQPPASPRGACLCLSPQREVGRDGQERVWGEKGRGDGEGLRSFPPALQRGDRTEAPKGRTGPLHTSMLALADVLLAFGSILG